MQTIQSSNRTRYNQLTGNKVGELAISICLRMQDACHLRSLADTHVLLSAECVSQEKESGRRWNQSAGQISPIRIVNERDQGVGGSQEKIISGTFIPSILISCPSG
jgi:hypothetical protein